MQKAPTRVRLTSLVLIGALCFASGCELVASFDRDKIPKPQLTVPDAALLPPGQVIEGGLPSFDGGLDASMDASIEMDAASAEDAGF